MEMLDQGTMTYDDIYSRLDSACDEARDEEFRLVEEFEQSFT